MYRAVKSDGILKTAYEKSSEKSNLHDTSITGKPQLCYKVTNKLTARQTLKHQTNDNQSDNVMLHDNGFALVYIIPKANHDRPHS